VEALDGQRVRPRPDQGGVRVLRSRWEQLGRGFESQPAGFDRIGALSVQLGLKQICPGPHVRDCVLTLIPFQITKTARQISQDLPIGKILEIAQIGCIEAKLEECIHDAVKQSAGLWAEIVRNFAPLGEPAERASVDLNSGKPGSRLSKVAAIAFAEMAPLIFCTPFNPISCFP